MSSANEEDSVSFANEEGSVSSANEEGHPWVRIRGTPCPPTARS